MRFDAEDEPDVSTVEGLRQELENQAALLISVATGGPRIDDVQADYQQRRQRVVRALEKGGLDYPFPWLDLWQWYEYWAVNLHGYQPRRLYIRELISPTLDAIERQRSGLALIDPGSRVGMWGDLDGRVAALSAELVGAVSRPGPAEVWKRKGLARALPRRPRSGVQSRGVSPAAARCLGSRAEGHAFRPRAH